MDFEEAELEIADDGAGEELDYFDGDIKDDELVYQLPKFSRIILYHGNSLSDDDWMRQRVKSDFDLKYSDESYSITEPYKYMSWKIAESNEILNDYLEDFVFEIKQRCRDLAFTVGEDGGQLANLCKELADEESLMTRFTVRTAVETYYAGRVRYGMASGKLSYKNIYLESCSSTANEIIPLDLSLFKPTGGQESSVASFSLFSGQNLLLKAKNLNGKFLRVVEFVDLNQIFAPHFPPKCPPILLEKEPFNIVCACGPFVSLAKREIDLTDTSYIKSLADYLKQYNPDVLFLFGPFFDDSQLQAAQQWSLGATLTQSTTYPYQWTLDKLLNYQLRSLCKEIEGLSVHTRIVLIPSANELGGPKIFPTYPADVKHFRPISSFANPSLLNLGGISVGATATDVLLHLSRMEIYNDVDNTERLKRLCGHILAQRNFYPLLPPDSKINLEYTQYNQLRMPHTPQLLLLPSILRPFIYNVNETIVINPGKVAKNSIARIKIDPVKDCTYYSGSLSQYINVEIIKLNKDL